jgi:hypothetical protein
MVDRPALALAWRLARLALSLAALAALGAAAYWAWTLLPQPIRTVATAAAFVLAVQRAPAFIRGVADVCRAWRDWLSEKAREGALEPRVGKPPCAPNHQSPVR